MTQGIDLQAHVIQHQSSNGFRNIRRVWLLDDELRLYDFISSYITRYGNLPSFDVLDQNGYILERHNPQPINYYMDQVSQRYTMTTARDQAIVLQNAVRSYNMQDVVNAQRALSDALITGNSSIELSTFQEEARNVMEFTRQALLSERSGWTTGYDVFDELTGGFGNGDLHIYVGRPNTGKSYYLLDNACKNWLQGARPLMISLEMSNRQTAQRMLSLYSGVDPKALHTGQISTWTRHHLDALVTQMDERPPFHFLLGEVRKSIDDVEAAIDIINPDIVYIDAGYLLSTSDNKYRGSRRESIAYVMEALKAVATRTGKCFIITVQFNRNIQTGRTKKQIEKVNVDMGLEDIGETDVIGQIASNIIGIHPPAKDIQSQMERVLQLLKNREGPIQTKIRTHFKFKPPNFNYISTVVDDDMVETHSANQSRQNLQNLGWMV